ncbi:MAG: hypothetical protein HAW58_02785 [Candidatus Thioglobus sp.]|nr:hypothetical protein [Candidatus Thioglobus sp.]
MPTNSDNRNINWSRDGGSANVATLTADGLLTALRPGSIVVVATAAKEPLRQIVANGGAESSVVLNNVIGKKGNYGYNVSTESYGDMLKMGILDPTKVVRAALQHAASISGLMITTEAMITEIPQAAVAVGAAPDMGGMGGMGGMM